MANAVSSIGNAIGNAVGGIGNAVSNLANGVGNIVNNVVQSIAQDPIKAVVTTVTAVYAPWALPLVEAADVLEEGGSLEDAVKAAAVSYVAGKAGQYVGSKVGREVLDTGTELGIREGVTKTAASAAAGAARGATVAVIKGQDPVKAMIIGGISSGVPALLGQVDGFAEFAKQNPIAAKAVESSVVASLTGRDITPALVNSLVASSGVATDILKKFDPDTGTDKAKLDPFQTAMVTDALVASTTAALLGKDVSKSMYQSMVNSGAKALDKTVTDMFKQQTSEERLKASAAYDAAMQQTAKVAPVRAELMAEADKYNAKVQEFMSLKEARDSAATAAQNVVDNPDFSVDTKNMMVAKANELTEQLNKRYTEEFEPFFKTQGAVVDKLNQKYATMSGDYEAAMQAFAKETDKFAQYMTPVISESNKSIVQSMHPEFDAVGYSKWNRLDPGVDPYTHWLKNEMQARGLEAMTAAPPPEPEKPAGGIMGDIFKGISKVVGAVKPQPPQSPAPQQPTPPGQSPAPTPTPTPQQSTAPAKPQQPAMPPASAMLPVLAAMFQPAMPQQNAPIRTEPTKIGYTYDWSSIFANPAQEKMFVSPYAQGGTVHDVNDELLNILRG